MERVSNSQSTVPSQIISCEGFSYNDPMTLLFWSVVKGAAAGIVCGVAIGLALPEILGCALVGVIISFALDHLGICAARDQVALPDEPFDDLPPVEIPAPLSQNSRAVATPSPRAQAQPLIKSFSLDQLSQRIEVNRVRQVLSKRPLSFSASHENYVFRNDLVVITNLAMNRKELIAPYRVWLNALNGTMISYEDGTQIPLDLSFEIDRLEGRTVSYSIEVFNPRTSNVQADLNQLLALETECFGVSETHKSNDLHKLMVSSESIFYFARRTGGNEILGYVYVAKEEDAKHHPLLHICGIGRKAGATNLGLGKALLTRMMSDNATKLPIFLEVRSRNEAAIDLYRKLNFRTVKRVPDHYDAPSDAALLMRLN
jgi:ribosomal-protein-alanine N-acetyltransferase